MPNYSYTCEVCGTFTIRQRISEQHETAACPSCERTAKREFVAFQTYKMDDRVKRRIEKGQRPRLVKREDLPMKPRPSQRATRPWMAGH
ncbi:FmdB family zinc ribbon protein [Staphylococcus delphini]|uniref:FmdB family zinc ribbon protein n=1 Tax=Staphylococcus delphini TaxID=53344 RepID=UPI0012D2C3C7|nr:FmdB family zinc ribbon protein [Staphylococcus delphini]MTV23131.1 zinc ribbon domain-containing protein [Staphylococcus delphini]UXS28785.1 zinc ribbon domain-containing protein [Staphylococcus delphini]UXS36388.1 zinc ribbon domain-containing protein [Staphylococcus delphini]UXS43866.1 zinc ribbon domain-containing protein [Staphylococcus delphini]UXV44491.1 zinc ribbon domain-containing protein [Staphylococcus delphini]